MAKIPDLAAIRDWCKSMFQPRGNYVAASDVPTQTSQLTNDSGYITKLAEDLENYYKKSETYTRSAADETFAEKTAIPTKTSDLENDRNFLTDTGDVSNTTVTFEQAAQRANVQSGDDLATAFAKLSMYCEDLKNVAFTGNYSDLSGTPQSLKNPNALTFTGAVTGSYDGSAAKSVAIPSGTNNLLATAAGTWLDAVQGKELNDKITQINSDLKTKVSSNSTGMLASMELTAATPFIDFHFGSSGKDYTSRIIESSEGNLNFQCSSVMLNGKKIVTEDSLPKVKDKAVYFDSNLTWLRAGAGMYFAVLEAGLPESARILAVSMGEWSGFKETDNVQVYIPYNSNSKFGFMSNVNTFISNCYTTVRILYV